jgi:chemotaxis methyl-accepting protein methylase
MSDSLDRVATLVRAETGIAITHRPALAAAIARTEPGLDAPGFLARAHSPEGAPLVAALIDEVTVQETYFFRELDDLRAIDWHGLLAAARSRGAQKVRVWVSACATGEEAYSLAMLASEAFGVAHPPVTILATDISGAALARAQAGRYNERSMRNVGEELRQRHFTRDGSLHSVRPALRALVELGRHNLIKDPAPPARQLPFDVIACRNVFIYFDAATIAHLVGTLGSALNPGGRLIFGAADLVVGTARRISSTPPRPEPPVETSVRLPLRRPLGVEPATGVTGDVAGALAAADAGDLDHALAVIGAILAVDPLDADAHFVSGLAELGHGRHAAAIASFRRALYIDPSFGLAAFQLGRAHDAAGDDPAARAAYARALRALDAGDVRHAAILDQVDLADIAAACSARLGLPAEELMR